MARQGKEGALLNHCIYLPYVRLSQSSSAVLIDSLAVLDQLQSLSRRHRTPSPRPYIMLDGPPSPRPAGFEGVGARPSVVLCFIQERVFDGTRLPTRAPFQTFRPPNLFTIWSIPERGLLVSPSISPSGSTGYL